MRGLFFARVFGRTCRNAIALTRKRIKMAFLSRVGRDEFNARRATEPARSR
jgi:hypothetical protein